MTKKARLENDEFVEEDETVSSEQLTHDLEEALEDVTRWASGERALRTSYKADDEWQTFAETGPLMEQDRQAEPSLIYDAKTDAMIIRITSSPIVRVDEVVPGVNLNYDRDGSLVSVEVLTASQRVRRPDVEEAA